MSPWLVLVLLLTLSPSLPSLKPSQLALILAPLHAINSLIRSLGVSFDLLAALLVVPGFFTLSYRSRPWSYNARVLLVVLNTYYGIRTLIHPPFSIFSSVPFSISPPDLVAIFPPGVGDPQLDELIARMSNVETRKYYIRFGHETMINAPSLGSWTIILATHIAFQLPAYIFVAGILATMTSLPLPFSTATSIKAKLTEPGITRAWLMITTFAVFALELYWTISVPIEAASSSSTFSSFFSKKLRIEIQPPIFEIARTLRTILFLIIPFIVHFFLLPQPATRAPVAGVINGSSNTTDVTTANHSAPATIQASVQMLNDALLKLRHFSTLHRIAVTQPRMTARWTDHSHEEANSVISLLSDPPLVSSANANSLSFVGGDTPLRTRIRGVVQTVVDEMNHLLTNGQVNSTGG